MVRSTLTRRRRVAMQLKGIWEGFGSLTLDPSPRLRRFREELEQRDLTREAWEKTMGDYEWLLSDIDGSDPSRRQEH